MLSLSHFNTSTCYTFNMSISYIIKTLCIFICSTTHSAAMASINFSDTIEYFFNCKILPQQRPSLQNECSCAQLELQLSVVDSTKNVGLEAPREGGYSCNLVCRARFNRRRHFQVHHFFLHHQTHT